jgi:hypothetical protein
MVAKIMAPNRARRRTDPTKPNSSARRANTKSVWASGRKAAARLRGVADALAQQPAGADGDLGLGQVVAVARGVDGGVDEHDEALELVGLEQVREPRRHGRGHDEGGERHDAGDGRDDPGLLGTGADDDGGARHEDDEAGSQVGLREDEDEGYREHAAQLEVVPEVLDLAVVLRAERRHEVDGHELGHLGRLEREADDGDPDPPRHAQRGVAEAGDARQEHEHDVDGEEGLRHVGEGRGSRSATAR